MSTSKPPATHDAPDDSKHELLHRLRNLDDMIRASEDAEDKFRRISERRRIPPVPDLRFEYSYTRSVSQYIHVERASATSSEKGKEKAVDGEDEQDAGPVAVTIGAGEIVRVDWGRVIWITTRDQVISPLVQGALWGVASHFLRPLGALMGAHIRGWWTRGSPRGSAPEGNGAQWLRNWMATILTPTPATNVFHR